MTTATAILTEFPAKFERLTQHVTDSDSIGIRQSVAYFLLVGSATHAIQHGDFWTNLSLEQRNNAREAAGKFAVLEQSWKSVSTYDRWKNLISRPRETVAINALYPQAKKLIKLISQRLDEDDRRAAYIAGLYSQAETNGSQLDTDSEYVTLTSEQIRSRSW